MNDTTENLTTSDMPELVGDFETTLYCNGYDRGYRVATARAESRRRLGLPIEGGGQPYRGTVTDDIPETAGNYTVS